MAPQKYDSMLFDGYYGWWAIYNFFVWLYVSTQSGTDTESARASRKQYKETLYSVLFELNVPAVCAVDQVCILVSLLVVRFD